MKLILTLLAILTGLSGGDVARAAPASPAALGFAITLAEAVVDARVAKAAHRPLAIQPRGLLRSALAPVRRASAAPVQSGFPPRGLRTRE